MLHSETGKVTTNNSKLPNVKTEYSDYGWVCGKRSYVSAVLERVYKCGQKVKSTSKVGVRIPTIKEMREQLLHKFSERSRYIQIGFLFEIEV
jgi:hypothetical protein